MPKKVIDFIFFFHKYAEKELDVYFSWKEWIDRHKNSLISKSGARIHKTKKVPEEPINKFSFSLYFV